ncbi:hypothetical protein VH79_26420, partial [Salmonella enterica]|nr:hypothetical protein [Salmonella enterica]
MSQKISHSWEIIADLGRRTIQVKGGTVYLVDAPYKPDDETHSLEIPSGTITLSVSSKLWAKISSGTPDVSVSTLGVHNVIPDAVSVNSSPGILPSQPSTKPVPPGVPAEPDYYFVIPSA